MLPSVWLHLDTDGSRGEWARRDDYQSSVPAHDDALADSPPPFLGEDGRGMSIAALETPFS